MSKIDTIIEQVEAMHPYKQSGNRDSYSDYNQGWSCACDIVQQRLEVLAPYIELAELYLGYINSGEIVYCLTEEDETRAIELYNKIKEQK